MIKASILNLFGTIVYFNESSNKSPYKKQFDKLHLNPLQKKVLKNRLTKENLNYKELDEFIEHIFGKKININELEEEVEQQISQVKLFPKSREYLDTVKNSNIKLGLISNLTTPYKQVLKNLNIETYFDTITFSCNVGYKKPQDEIYFQTLRKLGVKPSEAMMIGDNKMYDFEKPTELGISAFHLKRNNNSTPYNDLSKPIFQLQKAVSETYF